MRDAETVLDIIHARGKQGLPLEDVDRQLYNPDLYLRAYGKIYKNDGAMTRGSTSETVDGMSQEKISHIIDLIRQERVKWTPVRRTYIPKANGKNRPLGMPTWTDKLLQEVMRSILEAYYEPQFSVHSHGCRPKLGCHPALRDRLKWGGTVWFIEGDIKGYFDNIDHQVTLSILRENIHDNRFIRLRENLLKAGYLEDWTYHPTLSGTPQGGIISPILANIYLDRLAQFVETNLLPMDNKNQRRKRNREYTALQARMLRESKKGNVTTYDELRKQLQRIPSYDRTAPDFRRLHYVRYADDTLLGFVGPKAEAQDIKEKLRIFLADTLKLELSEEKTLITHAQTDRAKFLGYEITRCHNDTRHDRSGRRSINGDMSLQVPRETVRKRCQLYMKHGKPMHRAELMNDDDYTIVSTYQGQYRSYVQYFALAHNIHSLNQLRWIMLTSLLKTLSAKHKASVKKIAKRYKTTVNTSDGPRRCFEVRVNREGKKPLIARFGGIPLKRQPRAPIEDTPQTIHRKPGSNELIGRLLADTCDMCGSTKNCQVHHVKKLADLKKNGRRAKPPWMVTMIARRRKTLVVCHECHWNIHRGHPTASNG
jgi:group II intron reverse transcriptase/maturase